MSKTIHKRGVRTRHDPSLVRSLLAEREESGESFTDLETRSGIPASTLASSSRRSKRQPPSCTGFVEVVAAAGTAESVCEGDDAKFEILISSPQGDRRLLVPPRFNSTDLQRVVRALEETC